MCIYYAHFSLSVLILFLHCAVCFHILLFWFLFYQYTVWVQCIYFILHYRMLCSERLFLFREYDPDTCFRIGIILFPTLAIQFFKTIFECVLFVWGYFFIIFILQYYRHSTVCSYFSALLLMETLSHSVFQYKTSHSGCLNVFLHAFQNFWYFSFSVSLFSAAFYFIFQHQTFTVRRPPHRLKLAFLRSFAFSNWANLLSAVTVSISILFCSYSHDLSWEWSIWPEFSYWRQEHSLFLLDLGTFRSFSIWSFLPWAHIRGIQKFSLAFRPFANIMAGHLILDLFWMLVSCRSLLFFDRFDSIFMLASLFLLRFYVSDPSLRAYDAFFVYAA